MLVDRWATFRRHGTAVASYVSDRRATAPALVVAADLTDERVGQWTERFATAPRLLRVQADHYGMLRPPVAAEIATAIGQLQLTTASSS
jgi:hypothetical protein